MHGARGVSYDSGNECDGDIFGDHENLSVKYLRLRENECGYFDLLLLLLVVVVAADQGLGSEGVKTQKPDRSSRCGGGVKQGIRGYFSKINMGGQC